MEGTLPTILREKLLEANGKNLQEGLLYLYNWHWESELFQNPSLKTEGSQPLTWSPVMPPPLVFIPLCNLLPLGVDWTCNLRPNSGKGGKGL